MVLQRLLINSLRWLARAAVTDADPARILPKTLTFFFCACVTLLLLFLLLFFFCCVWQPVSNLFLKVLHLDGANPERSRQSVTQLGPQLPPHVAVPLEISRRNQGRYSIINDARLH